MEIGKNMTSVGVFGGTHGTVRWTLQVLRFARSKPLGATGLLILIAALIVALTSQIITPHDPWALNASRILEPPNARHWFGTDHMGRDLLSRTIYGTPVSIMVGLITVMGATLISAVVGITSAYYGGWFDLVVQRFVDAYDAFPTLLLALALITAFGASFTSVVTSLVIVYAARSIRVLRSQVLSIKEASYVEAARAIGAHDLRIMLNHVLPNTFGPMMVMATTTMGLAILLEASVSFLGVGMPTSIISWGGMLKTEILHDFANAPWVGLFPGFALTLVVFGINVFGDALRDVLDPRLRGR
jgi:peptide/nickel transport system permease protein